MIMLQNVHVPGRSIATDSASKSRIVMKCSCHIRLENVQESFIIDSHDIIIKVSDLPGRKESRIRVLSSWPLQVPSSLLQESGHH